jgi:hypothetical protein
MTIDAKTGTEQQVVHIENIADDPEYGPKHLALMEGYQAAIGILWCARVARSVRSLLPVVRSGAFLTGRLNSWRPSPTRR